MIHENLTTLAGAAKGRVLNAANNPTVNGLFTDTRTPIQGGLFVALRGENFDGNTYAREAVERHGAAAVLVDREQSAGNLPAILVEDTRIGFLNIAAAHRQRIRNCTWLGVTGSVGKSTTKEMLAHILKTVHPKKKIQKAEGSFNNEIGLSKTILETEPGTDFAVLELGTNHPGEIERLANAARPNIAVITRAAESHLEAFGSVENVAREKGTILNFQTPSDFAILNADDPHFEMWKGMTCAKVISFGLGAGADIRATQIELNAGARAQFTIGDSDVRIQLSVPGAHQVSNALAAIAAASAAGVSLSDAAKAAASFTGVARRFTIENFRGATLIDDAYNASPTSFAAALDTLSSMIAKRRFVVVGGMLELGAQSDMHHKELGAKLAQSNISNLILVGDLARIAGNSAIKHGFEKFATSFCNTPEEAGRLLALLLRRGDAALVKGSHGIHLERCLARARQTK